MDQSTTEIAGDYVTLDDEPFFRISNSHRMPEFFMSLTGASDHWMFLSSVGALTAGRCDPDSSLFPYAPDDQISAARGVTGPVTLIALTSADGAASRNDGAAAQDVWRPFAPYDVQTEVVCQNLYKNAAGTKLWLEEVNRSRQLTFRYRWTFSERFGFVRTCQLQNDGPDTVTLDLMDGLQNVLPYGVSSEFMMRFSNLANAYKKNELVEPGLGLFYLSSVPTDRAEPSEGLRCTTVWQTGLAPEAILLSSGQLKKFIGGQPVSSERDVRGRAGAYLVQQRLTLRAGEAVRWHLVAELARDQTDVVNLQHWLKTTENAEAEIAADIAAGERAFLRMMASADGLQFSANRRRCDRHLSNTVFNVMRGGIPLQNYEIDSPVFERHVHEFNRPVVVRHAGWFRSLPSRLNLQELRDRAAATHDHDLVRLAREYLPLAFSRRHGDPTRPWNRFAIQLRSADGRTSLNYQGNWRDLFQNWEALALSFPDLTVSMVCRFVNATTADGYNPYRVTSSGVEWEEPSPEDPWANIGYWGDHQIIYLLKLLEWNRRTDPDALAELLAEPTFVHTCVPYRIRSFDQIRKNPRDTIEFDSELAAAIAQRVEQLGSDGRLLTDQSGNIHYVTLVEKLLTLSLAKLSNFVPDGGIWLNTQRPEWNDANNALVGNGLSMVTACYLYRWFRFLEDWLGQQSCDAFSVSVEVADFFSQIQRILNGFNVDPSAPMSPSERARIVSALSECGSDYRRVLYEHGLSGRKADLARDDCVDLFRAAQQHLQTTIQNNRRDDGLYHSYNLLQWTDGGLAVEHLYEMLEGQVAVLSSGLFQPEDAVSLLDALRRSALYREDQQSYLLYPDRQLPRFLQKNAVSQEAVSRSPLLRQLLADGCDEVIRKDVCGGIHFNGRFRNSADLRAALHTLPSKYKALVQADGDCVVELFEEIFGHRRFTGRSGTFFAYEGLGSIYWHMVSKLGLAVVENFFAAVELNAPAHVVDSLRDHFRQIRFGIGAEKSPADYGAFPSDPYSHTPENAGVKQPGMTGQVKEDILSRIAELSIAVKDGSLVFRPELLDSSEFLAESQQINYYDVSGTERTLLVPAGALMLTFCQVPVIVQSGTTNILEVEYSDGRRNIFNGLSLGPELTRRVFSRSGDVASIKCEFRAPSPS